MGKKAFSISDETIKTLGWVNNNRIDLDIKKYVLANTLDEFDKEHEMIKIKFVKPPFITEETDWLSPTQRIMNDNDIEIMLEEENEHNLYCWSVFQNDLIIIYFNRNTNLYYTFLYAIIKGVGVLVSIAVAKGEDLNVQ